MHRVLVHVPVKRALFVTRRHLICLEDAGSPRGLHDDVAGVAHLMLMMIALIEN